MERIFIAGHNGMVGSAINKILSSRENTEILTRSRFELDLLDQRAVELFFREHRPDSVFIAAAKVGGIYANSNFPAEFVYHNLMIQSNIIHSSYQNNVAKLLFLGSSCIYPKDTEQPMTEEALLSGKLEKTNQAYAIAKIAGIQMIDSYKKQYGLDYRSVMPTNLYGPGDNFHPRNSHVIPALIRRFHEAKLQQTDYVTIWGTGDVYREFMHVDDMASACIHLMELPSSDLFNDTSDNINHINIGSGKEIKIYDLAVMIAKIVGFKGKIITDTSKPDGVKKKLLDSTRLFQSGWNPKIDLYSGLEQTYSWFLKNEKSYREG